MKNIFEKTNAQEVINRIEKLTPDIKGEWGKMNVDQMLAHCNVTYEMVFDDKHKRPNGFVRFMLKLLVKPSVVGEKRYPKNGNTAPQFLIKGNKEFKKEKKRLITYINKTVKLGEAHFEGKESHSFGNLKAKEWNNMFYKHLDHHLNQFGV